MELSILIVNWNSTEYLRECVTSIYEQTRGVSFEIIVVDNASPVDDVDSVKEQFPEIKLIKSKENLGFAKANNVAFRHSAGSYVLLLNPDTKLVNPAIDLMFDWIRKLPDAGIVGCKHLNPDLTVQTTSIQKFPTISNQVAALDYFQLRWPRFPMWDIGPLFSDSRRPTPVDMVPGACMMLRREVFARVGGFSEEYFMYAEDIDLNFKINRAGFKTYYIPDAVLIHYGGKSSSQMPANQWATTMKLRAMRQYYTKNYGRLYAELYRISQASCAIVRLLLMALAFPLSGLLWNRRYIQRASAKWKAVLKWGLGLDSFSASRSLRS